jgi:hypothetical protein
MTTQTTGRQVNDLVRESGVVALVDLAGDRLWFFPRGRLPKDLAAYLNMQNGHAAFLLRDFIVTLGREIVPDDRAGV